MGQLCGLLRRHRASSIPASPIHERSLSTRGSGAAQISEGDLSQTLVVNEELCEPCRQFFSGRKELLSGDGGGQYHRSFPLSDLSQTCKFCRLLQESIQHEKMTQFGDTIKDIESICIGIKPSSTKTNIRLSLNCSMGYYLHHVNIDMMLAENTVDELDRMRYLGNDMSNTASSSTSSDLSLGLIKAWLRNRHGNHSICSASHTSPRSLPTRLLEIGNNKVLLRSSTGLSPETCYVTLSHCWGGLAITCLTKSCFSAFTEVFFPIDQLTPTFTQAISFCEKLGIRYIWIDSLCIVQDSYEDWLTESNRMWQVYSNSYCNLAATASTDGHGGLFRQRDPDSLFQCKVHVEWDGFASGDYYCSYQYEWNKEVEKAPLNKRGWVLQERLLAPRVLHFGDQQLYWECKEFAASKTQHGGLSKEMIGTTLKQGWHLLRTQMGTDSADRCYSAWEYSISHYSNCGLSKSFDKLMALSGLARRLHNCLEERDTYLASLWRSQLPRSLLWRNSGNIKLENLGTRLMDYRAPSWSWASLSNVVKFPNFIQPSHGDPIYEEATPLVEVLEAMTTPAGDPKHCSPFGLVADGMIRLRGRLFRVCINLESRGRDGVNPLRISAGKHGHFNHPGFHCMHDDICSESSTYRGWTVSLDEKFTQAGTPICLLHAIFPPPSPKPPSSRRQDD